MLGLQFETETSWVDVAQNGLEQLLTDHAFAEIKASGNATSIIINYSCLLYTSPSPRDA